ncbi:MAG TPA: FHA domain-containing protein [Ktedonobacteraceae bacterium]
MQNSQSPGQCALHYQGRFYPLNKAQIIIGSDPSCDVRIENNPRILSMHAQVVSQTGQVFLLSMERNAGIWVNGIPTSQQQLQDQDEIALGDGETRLKLLLNWNANGVRYTNARGNAGAPEGIPGFQSGSSSGRHAATQARENKYAAGLGPQPLPPTRPAASPYGIDPEALTPTAASAPFADPGPLPPTTPPLGAAPAFEALKPPVQQIAFAPQPQAQPAQQMAFAPQAQAAQQMGFAPQPQAQPAPQMAFVPPPQDFRSEANTATNTTRYLCAAGHLDETFQDYVLRHVIHEERRSLGESYGVDMLAVVSWCKAGIARINVRDSILTILLALNVVIYIIVTYNLLASLAYFRFTPLPYNPYNNPYGNPYAPAAPSFSPILGTGLVLLLDIPLCALYFILLFSLEKWIRRRWPKTHPGILSLMLAPLLFIPYGLLLFPLGWLVILIELIARFYSKVTNDLRKYTFSQQSRPVVLDFALETKLRESFSSGQRNVVAYSGYRPFAGAGIYLTGWSFVVDTSKGAPLPLNLSGANTRLTPTKFTTGSLYEAIERDARELGLNDVLEIEGKLYVRGQYVPEHQYFFNPTTMRPVTSVDQRLVDYYKENPTEDIRYYQCLRFNSWRGELVFTAFLRLFQRGKSLFIEFDYLLLPPLHPDYYWVDEREITPTFGKIWELFLRSFDKPVWTMLTAPYRLLRGPIYTAQQNKLARVASNNPAFDYGAPTSLRYAASDDEYHLFFQKLDKEMYLKIIQKQMLETIHKFLQANQIDTSDFNQQQQMILNSGTIVSGGNINIGALSTGSGGQAYNHGAPPETDAQPQSQLPPQP